VSEFGDDIFESLLALHNELRCVFAIMDVPALLEL
jgi:hypothetical protein